MKNFKRIYPVKTAVAVIIGGMALQACSNMKDKNHYLIAATGTIVGIDISQDETKAAPHFTLGYKRAELAIVPTNRGSCAINSEQTKIECETGGNAKDVPNVLMELRYGSGTAANTNVGIYQRLAVGTEAVQQPGASMMFVDTKDEAEAVKTLGQYKSSYQTQTDSAVAAISCYDKLDNGKKHHAFQGNRNRQMIQKITFPRLKTVVQERCQPAIHFRFITFEFNHNYFFLNAKNSNVAPQMNGRAT